MSRRTAKKRLKKINQVQGPVAEAPAYEMFLQYQNSEFLIEEIAQRILDKCAAEGMDGDGLKIYVKPEDRKAYYACAGGSSYIDL